jgi:pimeloyl-ACP methyl ester carboxylesterase
MILILSTGCSRIRSFLPVVRDKVSVSNYNPVPDPKVCIGLPEGLSQPANASCYYIDVPEDRTEKKSPLINLYVTVIKDESVAEPADDPIVVIFDGPGLPISLRQYQFLEHFLNLSALTSRRVIIFDMRGAGNSRPALSCYIEKPELLVNPDYDWITPCVERLESEAINIESYNPLQIAHDVADIARALGYSQINIWARGFGTSVGLRVAEMYPNLVRSMILESVNTVFSDLGLPTGLNGALDRAFQDCENNDFCTQQFPELRQTFADAYVQLQSDPIRTAAGLLDPDGFIWDIYTLLSETTFGSSLLPAYITAVHNKNIEDINAITVQLRKIDKNQIGVSDMLQSVYVCSEIMKNGTPEDILTQINTSVRPEIFDVIRGWVFEDYLPFCNNWPDPGLDNASGGRVNSSVPILMVAGTYEPRFSLESAYFTKVTLDNSAIVAVQGVGRNPLFYFSECAMTFLSGFFNNPALIPESQCLNQQINYIVEPNAYEPAADIDLKEFHDFDVPGLTVSGSRPAEWIMLETGQYLRKNFENDPTALLHLYEKGASAENMVSAYFYQAGLVPVLQSNAELVTQNGLAFQISQYAVETPDYILVFDVATFDTDWGGFVIVLKTSEFEYGALHEAVFLPAVQAFTFY